MGVTKRRPNASKKTAGRKIARPRTLVDEAAGLYKPIKKPVTLRLDADVLDWFKKRGRGYQTRINQALRNVMRVARKGPSRP